MQKPQLLEKMCVGQLCLTYLVNIENRLDVCDNVDFLLHMRVAYNGSPPMSSHPRG